MMTGVGCPQRLRDGSGAGYDASKGAISWGLQIRFRATENPPSTRWFHCRIARSILTSRETPPTAPSRPEPTQRCLLPKPRAGPPRSAAGSQSEYPGAILHPDASGPHSWPPADQPTPHFRHAYARTPKRDERMSEAMSTIANASPTCQPLSFITRPGALKRKCRQGPARSLDSSGASPATAAFLITPPH